MGNYPHDQKDFMKRTISEASEIGQVVRAARKVRGIRQDDAAGSLGVSENFLGKIERGGDSVQWDKLFEVLTGLGIRVILDMPQEAHAYLTKEERRSMDKAP